MWPVSPLADPALVRFGEWLPVDHRRGKHLLRDTLTRAGLPEQVAYPPLRENLADIMTAGLVGGGLDLLEKIAADSHLVDLGLVNGPILRQTVAATRMSGRPREADHQLFRVAVVELFLRALAG